MRGRRLPDAVAGEPGSLFNLGDYQKQVNGNWLARPPEGHCGNLVNHTVVENPDGTITVTPSIKIWNSEGEWHGHLTDGIWIKV